jgi:CRISPR/Cas system CSM-associated protein Csm3 (group 7 of RAMP superfamily)
MVYKPVSKNQKRSPIQDNPHDVARSGDLSGVLHCHLVVKSKEGLHPGTGQLEVRDQGLVASLGSRFAGLPSLPGSGLKGAVRSVYETFTGSCGVFDDKPWMTCSDAQPCNACCVFGRLGHGGNLGFQEFVCRGSQYGITRVAEAFQGKPTGLTSDRRFYDGSRPEVRDRNLLPQSNPVEVLPQGSELTGSMWFRFLPRLAIGQVLVAMGLGVPKLRLRVGGKKFDGLGQVDVVPTKLELRDHAKLGRASAITGQELVAWIQQVAAEGVQGTPGAKEVLEQLAKL